MTDNVTTAIYSSREGLAWHSIGQEIPADAAKDPRKMAALLGADYTVAKRPCFYMGANGAYMPVDGREVLVREDTGAMLEVVSDSRYHVLNRQPVDVLEAFRDELAANKLEISHGAVLGGGTQIAVCAYLPPEHDIVIGGNDVIRSYITLATGYDKKHGTRAFKSTFRVVCQNTLNAGVAEAEKADQIRTIRASSVLEETSLKGLLSRVNGLVASERQTYTELANTRMSSDEVSRYFADVLEIDIASLGKFNANGSKLVSTRSQNMLRELASAYSSSPGASMATGTAWGALNAVTYYATHVKGVRDMTGNGSGVNAARIASNLNGDAARLKMRALQLAASKAFSVAA